MTAIYIGLSYLLLEVFTWKKLSKYSAISTSLIGFILILTVSFEKINIYNLELISKDKLFVLVPLFLLTLITSIFEYRFDKDYIYIKRMVLYATMVITINIELVYVVFVTVCVLYEIYNRSIKSNFVIKTNLIILIPFILTLPMLSKVESISYYYGNYIIVFTVILTILDFHKFNVFRALSLLMLSCLLLNLTGNAVPSVLISILLLVVASLLYLNEHELLQKQHVNNKYIDRFLHKGYIFFEKKEKSISLKQAVPNQYIFQKEKINIISHHNDVVTSFISVVIIISVLGLYVIFRN